MRAFEACDALVSNLCDSFSRILVNRDACTEARFSCCAFLPPGLPPKRPQAKGAQFISIKSTPRPYDTNTSAPLETPNSFHCSHPPRCFRHFPVPLVTTGMCIYTHKEILEEGPPLGDWNQNHKEWSHFGGNMMQN